MQTAIHLFKRSLVRPVRRLVDAVCLYIRGGIGDHMMLTIIARELERRGQGRVFILSEHPDVYLHNADVEGVAGPGSRLGRFYTRLAGERTLTLSYLIN